MEGDNKTYKIVGEIPGAKVDLSAGSMKEDEAKKRVQVEQTGYENVGIGVKVKVVPDENHPKWK